MLNDLYNYAVKKELVSRPGFKPKSIKAYILLSRVGQFLGFDPGPSERVMCPDIGSAAQGISKCNILVEKAEIVLLLNPDKIIKHNFYKNSLEAGVKYDPLFRICLAALDTPDTLDVIRQTFISEKYKSSDPIGFKVDNIAVQQSKDYFDWWEVYRKEQNPSKSEDEYKQRCLITGEVEKPVVIVPKVPGLSAVGGHTSGDSFICFDKEAFCSYNLKQANNASVSEEAVTAVNAALSDLISRAPINAGSKFVHWYKEPLEDKYDPIMILDSRFIPDKDADEDQEEDYSEIIALDEAKKLIESVKRGEKPQYLNNRYYIMSISGANGRIMVRSYFQGNYEELYESVKAWFDDLEIELIGGGGYSKPPKLFAINIRLLKREKMNKNLSERMKKELSGIEPQLYYSIFNNTSLPDCIAARALNYIRSDMLDSNEDSKKSKIPDMLCCELLKIWLIRKEIQEKNIAREEATLKETLNPDNPSTAYHAGRMMAIFAAIQTKALGDVGAGVIQRYYASASTSPALVIGKLSTLSQHHLSKIESKGLVNYYTKLLAEISEKIGYYLPTALSLEEQSQFALGYYQQTAQLYQSKKSDNETED